MPGRFKSSSAYRATVLLLVVFLSRMTQAADFGLPYAIAIGGIDTSLLPSIQLDLASISNAGDINIFEVPLVGRITGFGFRSGTADGGQFEDLDLLAAFVDFRLPWQWSAGDNVTVTPRLTLEVGRFADAFEHREFGSLGPSFRFENERSSIPMFLDLGISPTVIDGAQYGDRDLGTSFNFTSYVAFGLRFGRDRKARVSLRYQHISNGGINSTNPGVNSYGLDVVVWSRK